MTQSICIVRDNRFLEHETGLIHPEHSNRLKAIHSMLDADFSSGLINIRPEPANIDELELVHTPGYIEKVLNTADFEFTHLAPDTPASAKTYLAAWLAVGGCLKALEALMWGRCRAGFAFVRPPGHHALPDRASGFCIFNNLGITARQAMRVYGLDRILIVDWDTHHGNGLQHLFYYEKEVLYFSTHYLSSFPQTGDWTETGQGPGLGYTVNIPIPKNAEDDDLLHCYREVLGSIIRQYRPQLILVAAGFDAHISDPLSHTCLTERGYEYLTRLIMDLGADVGDPPILLSLEGGYDTEALVNSIRGVLKALIDEGPRPELPRPVTSVGYDLINRASQVHASYGVWLAANSEERTGSSRRV